MRDLDSLQVEENDRDDKGKREMNELEETMYEKSEQMKALRT